MKMGLSPGKTMAILAFAIVFVIAVTEGAFGGHADRVLLREINALTLYKDRMTSGRRSSPVPQLSCVGGTAKGLFTPSVVQCYNRGWDGNDIQWECKTDMDNAFRFGSVEVTCEGYDYPDDPYILKGSCGLEYTLDLTEEGYQRYRQQKSHSYHDHHSSYQESSLGKKSKSVIGDLLFLGGIALVIYIIYKSCIAPSAAAATAPSGSQGHQGRGDSPPPYSPPPYGFREDYMPGSDGGCGSTMGGSGAYTGTGTRHGAGGGGGGGFWSGAATGGLLGYMFGRNSGGRTYTHYQQPHNTGWGSGWGSSPNTGWFSGSGSSSTGRSSNGGSWGGGGGGGSSGTRTASGFGGTKRR